MRTNKFTFSLMLLLLIPLAAFNQTARVQVIHNSADLAAKTVDVYLNDVILLDDFEFRSASPFVDAPAGTEIEIDVAPSNSASSDDSIYGIKATLTADETYILVASGIISETGYSPAQPFEISVYGMGMETGSDPAKTDVLVYHGVTDAPKVGVWSANPPVHLISPFEFGDFSNGYKNLDTDDYVLEIRDESGGVTVASYSAPLATLELENTPLVVVASGFLTPSNNSNGPVIGLYAALPSGGDLVELPAAYNARLQVIHNSADAAVEMVDVYLNDELLIPDFEFRTASAYIDAPAGAPIKVNIAPSNSTSSMDAIYTIEPTLEKDKTYVGVASGIVSESGYAPATPFSIELFDMAREEASASGNTDLLVYHGSTDAPTVDVYEATGPGELVNDVSYGDFDSDYLELPASDYYIQVRTEDGTTPLFAYDAPLAALGLQDSAIVTVASGFVDPSVNSDGPAFGLYAALPEGGDLVELPASTARVQVIHNSADEIADSVDVYLNGEILLDDFPFRSSTPFIDAPAYVPIDIDVAPKTSADVSETFYNLETTLAADETYILVASGIESGSGYSPATPFGISVYDMGRETAETGGNTDVLVFHGSTDAPTVDIYESTAGELIDNASYGDFAGYLGLAAADYMLEVRDETGSAVVGKFGAPLQTLGLEDAAITVVASGFLDPSVNSDGPVFGLYASLASGGELVELPPYTVKDVIVNSEDHTTLETAVIEAGLDEALASPGKLTVFAPTDAAFDNLPDGLLDELLADPTGNLAQILLYHVAGDSVRSTSLVDDMMISTLKGQDVTVDLDGGVFINNAQVTTADIKANNGIVHVIDAVLVPENDVKIAEDGSLGSILTDKDGNTLYFFTKDVNDTSVCVDGCIANWPAFYTPGLFLPEGLDRGDFGSFERPDGSMQYTYKGWPLYYFVNDNNPGDVNGEGVNNVWYVAKPDYTIMLMDNQLVGNDDINYKGDYTEGDEIIQYFTDDYGYTLYTWINDDKNTNNFTNEDFSNNGVWPIYEEDTVVAPSVLEDDKFGVIDVYGRNQLTYNGWPLYYFGSDDSIRGNTKGVSVPTPGVWPVAVQDIDMALPATVVDVATSDTSFNTLVAALTKDGLETDFVDVLSGEGPFTVFAPTNDAFAALLDELGASSLDDIDNETLERVLKMHVVSGKVMAGDLTEGQKAATLLGDSIMFSLADGAKITDPNGRISNIIATDVEAKNGVVHVIDTVILPAPLPATVVDIATSDDNFSTLVTALTRESLTTDFVTVLSGEGPFTVFAPTNDAFAALLNELGAASLDDINDETLENVLKMHVVSGKVKAGDLSEGLKAETLFGDSIMFSLTDGATITDPNGRVSNITATDIEAQNGVVHVIDTVILPNQLPATVVDIATSDDNFSTLVTALTRESLTTDFVTVLSGEGPFTVFAPTNDAFTALLNELGVASLDDIDDETLESVLKMHVVSGKVMAGDLTEGLTAQTLLDETITFSLVGGATITDPNGRVSNITATDIEAQNGVVHVIDTVILPEQLPATVVDIATSDDNFSTLVDALTKEGLATDFVSVLSGEGPFTVFAPTNDAFTALLNELGASSLDDIDLATLENVLKMHVVSGKVMAGDLTEGLTAQTLLEESITFSLVDGATITDPNGRVSNITATDIEAQNGVVHVIDTVILPLLTSVENEILTAKSVNVYPNPASSVTTIEYGIKERNEVKIEVYNVLGSKIRNVNLGSIPEGTYRHQLNVGDLENGMYFVIIRSGNDQVTRSLNIVR